jgi:UPF0271 protein
MRDRTGVRRIDLNADLGEGVGDEAGMLALVSSANIACGGHAGGPDTMHRAMRAACARGVSIGAHPGYADRENFGRVELGLPPDSVERLVAAQLGAACGVAALAGARIAHVKPHGALYNRAADDAGTAATIIRAVQAVDRGLWVLCLAGSVLERLAREAGLRVAAEVLADRGYRRDGRLLPRGMPGAVLHDPVVVAARIRTLLEDGVLNADDGTPLTPACDSICLHGDTAGSVTLARSLRHGIEAAGWTIAPFARC